NPTRRCEVQSVRLPPVSVRSAGEADSLAGVEDARLRSDLSERRCSGDGRYCGPGGQDGAAGRFVECVGHLGAASAIVYRGRGPLNFGNKSGTQPKPMTKAPRTAMDPCGAAALSARLPRQPPYVPRRLPAATGPGRRAWLG